MKCNKCSIEIPKGEDRTLHSQILCEDCYMDMLSPAKACDPWAVYAAKSFAKEEGKQPELNDNQKKILHILEETGGIEPQEVIEKLKIKKSDFERDTATLRHMEKVRGEIRNGKKIIRLW
ncbi:MAG: hypothetical protein HQK76_01860 [Desulfobacterales bacterium]|nr:hypothetical protein [Desulfobacterales bacterium]